MSTYANKGVWGDRISATCLPNQHPNLSIWVVIVPIPSVADSAARKWSRGVRSANVECRIEIRVSRHCRATLSSDWQLEKVIGPSFRSLFAEEALRFGAHAPRSKSLTVPSEIQNTVSITSKLVQLLLSVSSRYMMRFLRSWRLQRRFWFTVQFLYRIEVHENCHSCLYFTPHTNGARFIPQSPIQLRVSNEYQCL